jgi:DNA-binding Xre family transcriptional regulator
MGIQRVLISDVAITRQRRLHEYCPAEGAFTGADAAHDVGKGTDMASKLDYRWNLRTVMAGRGMFQTTDLIDPLARRDIELSSSQVYRLVVERPERLSLKVLMALLDILDCTMDDLIEPVAVASATTPRKKAVGAADSVGDLRPKRARIRGVE